jgi:hypothetical protein
MIGYEYELQRQRNQRLQSQAETERLLNTDKQAASAEIRKVLGAQLIKLGTRLQR